MGLWLVQDIEPRVLAVVSAAALVLVGHLAERHFTGRVTMFTNWLALATFFAHGEDLWLIFQIYMVAAAVFAAAGLLSYLARATMTGRFYLVGQILLSTPTTGFLLLIGITSCTGCGG